MRRSYVVEVLFTLILFTVFVLGSFFILLFGADAYRSLVDRQNEEEQIRLSLAYLSTRVHSAPSKDAISLSEIEGTSCLLIREQIQQKTYVTAVFWKDGALMEAFSEESRLKLEQAVKIAEVNGLTMQEENGQLILTAWGTSEIPQSLVLIPR